MTHGIIFIVISFIKKYVYIVFIESKLVQEWRNKMLVKHFGKISVLATMFINRVLQSPW